MNPDELQKLVIEIIGEDGVIGKTLNNFEYRSQQFDMAQTVANALSSKKHAIIEAGTGVGKSFGYLVPAILYSVFAEDNVNGRIVISTYTKNLQEQLAKKDIPFLKDEVFDFDFTAIAVKGRGNYLCRRRLKRARIQAASLFTNDNQITLDELTTWSEITETGDLEEFQGQITSTIRESVNADKDSCPGRKCEFYKSCFYNNLRKEMHKAQILIVNHALLFSDLKLRIEGASFLPEYNNLIFDETHNLEKIATDHFGGEGREAYLDYLFGRLLNKSERKGLLVDWDVKSEFTIPLNQCKDRTLEYFDAWRDYVAEMTRNKQARDSKTLKIEGNIEIDEKYPEFLNEFAHTLADFSELAEDDEKALEIKAFASRFMQVSNFLEYIKEQNENIIRWVDIGRNRKIILSAAPVLVNSILRKYLFSALDSVTMTSATISTGTDDPFIFFKDRVGINYDTEENANSVDDDYEINAIVEQKLGSPFNFKENAILITPRNLVDPYAKDSYEENLREHILRAVDLTQGGAFVLFTSYSLMNKLYDDLRETLEDSNYQLFIQNSDKPRSQLLDEFKQTSRGILFGTDSFWQGVDVQGDTLRLVIITKLPFDVPSDPLFKARSDQLEKTGKNSFLEFSIPLAVLKFVQGFGRLIRHREDKGLIVVLDKRLTSKNYGRYFLDSIPKCTRLTDYPQKLPFTFNSENQKG
ncbi:MAG: hypothetical protein K8S87_02835 [Planctomycetes bacterium]|nr:hypothetical protein [Planctomycetota bacterium]